MTTRLPRQWWMIGGCSPIGFPSPSRRCQPSDLTGRNQGLVRCSGCRPRGDGEDSGGTRPGSLPSRQLPSRCQAPNLEDRAEAGFALSTYARAWRSTRTRRAAPGVSAGVSLDAVRTMSVGPWRTETKWDRLLGLGRLPPGLSGRGEGAMAVRLPAAASVTAPAQTERSPSMADPRLLQRRWREPVSDATSLRAEPFLSRLNRHGFRLVMVADALVLAAVMVGSMVVRYDWVWPTYPPPTYAMSLTVTLTVFIASLYFGGLYEREPRLGAPPALPRVARQTLAAGGLVALLRLATPGLARETPLPSDLGFALPIPNLVALIVLGAIGVAGNRWFAQVLRTRREGPPRVVLGGEPSDLAVARSHLDAERDRAKVMAEISDLDQLLVSVEATRATDVVVVSGSWVDGLYPDQVRAFDQAGVTVLLRVTARETLYGLERVREVGGLPFVLLRAQTMPRSRARFKRFFDVVMLVVASPLIVALGGLMALYQLAVAGRPLLYFQPRVGADGRVFEMVKFRTMLPDAEADGRGARLADHDDPRIIRGCRWVRATRMDELPQLWNVVRGEMSLVGPRPERPELTAGFEASIPGYARRHELPPGLTGLAQIHGRYHTDPEYKLGYDLQYLVNWSPVLDLQILLRTVWVVLTRRL
jgi:lipopolysaccharide/colanic/teichoic acid biosynthesis glycosyltransferase